MYSVSIHFSDCVINKETGKSILSGMDHFIGNPEKRRNKEIIQVVFPYNYCNYAMFYKGSNDILKAAAYAISNLLSFPEMTEKEKASHYKTIIESLYIVHHVSTKNRNSKLNGINSLSTSCIDNCFCLDRMKNNDSVCSHCYSNTQQKIQLSLQDRNTINGIILRNIVIPSKYWKKYISKADITRFFRLESFGDVANKTQALNYIEFCKAFPRVHFAAWTKNIGIWNFAFMQADKPENLSFIVSSNKVNHAELYHKQAFNNVNHIFTVYDKDYIRENNIDINCGGRCCMDCIKKHKACYFTDTELEIREQLK